MIRRSLLNVFSVLALTAWLWMSAPQVHANTESTNDLDIQYHSRGLEIIELKLSDKTVLPGGEIQARLHIHSKTALTYGMSISVQRGAVSGAVLDGFVATTTASIPLTGKRTLDLGTVTFSPDSQLSISLKKFGGFADEEVLFATFDLLTAVSLYGNAGYLAGSQHQYEPGSREAVLGLVTTFTNGGMDQAALKAQINQKDFTGIYQNFGKMLTMFSPEISGVLANTFSIQVTPGEINQLGKLLEQRSPVAKLTPLLYDFMQKPDAVQVDIQGVSPSTFNVDVVLSIDTSDSMYPTCLCPSNPSGEDRIGPAKAAAKSFIDHMHLNDSIGVVSFGRTAVTNYPLTPVTPTTQTEAKNSIDAITANGTTSIGASLQAALNSIRDHGNPNNPHSILMISDGAENTSPYAGEILPDLISRNIAVYTIGLGDTADADLLQSIASATGGTYTFSPTPADLGEIYNGLIGVIRGRQTVVSGRVRLSPGATDQKTVKIGGREATFTVNWTNQAVAIGFSLVGPSGQVIDPTTSPGMPSVAYFNKPGIASYHIIAPEAGTWTMRITSPASAGEDLDVYYTVTELNDLKMDAYANSNTIRAGEPITLYATLYSNLGLVSDATVTATVEPGDVSLDLLDDGAGADATAGDGIYTGVYEATTTTGSYLFLVNASRDDFHRQADVTVVAIENKTVHTDLWIEHHDEPPALPTSGSFSYQVVFGNNGPDGVNDVTITEHIPDGFTLVSSSLGTPNPLLSSLAQWKIANIPANTYRTITITLHKTANFQLGKDLNQRVSVYASDLGSDDNQDNNESSMQAYQIYQSMLPTVRR